MGHLNFLEQFEEDGVAVRIGPPAQDLPGYDAGYEAGLIDAAKQHGQLSAVLVDHLSDMQFGYAEAQQAMMQALIPFVAALTHQILPAISNDLLRTHVKDVLLTAANADISHPIALTCHPQTATTLKDVLAQVAHVEVTIFEDATLDLQEVYIGTKDAETQLDIAGLISGIQSALSNIASAPGEVGTDG